MNATVRKMVYNKLREAISEGIKRNGERIFAISQNTQACYVPVRTGMLKKSGYVNRLNSGIEIGYLAPYASDVEFGKFPQPIKGTQIVHIRKYRRKDGTIVKAHDKKYVDKMVVVHRPRLNKFQLGKPRIMTISKTFNIKPHLFLTRAVEAGIVDLVKDIEYEIRRKGFNVR